MLKIVQRTTLGALLLIAMPLCVWLSGWQWQPGESGGVLRFLFWMTETVTSPWGIITSSVLSACRETPNFSASVVTLIP